MNKTTFVTLFLLLLLFLFSTVCSVENVSAREAAVRDVFREMLHITPPEDLSAKYPAVASPPKHMVELYNKYASKRGPMMSSAAANTVRNILPTKGPPGLEPVTELLFFNVTCVGMEEEVRLGQLHLNRRRLHQRHHHYHRKLLAPPYRVRLYQVTDARTKALGSVPVPQIIRGSWHSIDITPALKELLLVPRGSSTDIMLGIRFEAPRGKTLSPKHFLRETADNSPAFLVVFSEDSSENEVTEDGLLPSPGPPVHTHAMVQKLQSTEHGDLFRGEVIDDKDNYPEMIPFSGIRRNLSNLIYSTSNYSTPAAIGAGAAGNYTEHSTVSTPVQTEKTTSKKPIDLFTRHTRYMARQLPHDDIEVGKSKRMARSIVDNELPDSDTPSPDLILPKTSPGSLLLARPRSDIIPIPENTARRWRKGRRNRKRRGRKQKSWVPDDSWQNVYQESGEVSGTCTVRKLEVNFADIGWGDWIISPHTFEANYCAGTCPFPLTKALNPTNHAALQSLVHALGRSPHVPAPYCVPDHLSPTTLLYMDEAGNVVLKNYPSMSVESCACR